MRKCLIVVACVSLVLGWVAPVKAVDDADAAMAARIADMGTDTLRTKNASDPQYKQCIALLKAAAKLNPDEERYPRLMVEACMAIGDVEGALPALRVPRHLRRLARARVRDDGQCAR